MSQLRDVKNRFGIVGNSPMLDRALDIALQVAPTNLSVLITGESGVGKEVFSKIIHASSTRKHGGFIAVNCGAIPEGTIDSELFGHEKGSFTGATDARKGYFEVVNGGTIFLDEVADLPLPTQVRLLRVLETGEFMRVGSSKVQKTDVRVVAATNLNMMEAISRGKFREDLYYRLNSIPIRIPSLRERATDVPLLFLKFAVDFAERYRMPPLKLRPESADALARYRWPGNIRQLKNLAEQISILESEREVTLEVINRYLPDDTGSFLPAAPEVTGAAGGVGWQNGEREMMLRAIYDLRKELDEVKQVVVGFLNETEHSTIPLSGRFSEHTESKGIPEPMRISESGELTQSTYPRILKPEEIRSREVEESLKLEDKELEIISKALEKHKGKRKLAAKELGISERTLYRKIKAYGLKY
jgi:transcriptional regulator with PAS, ATPase and Fis domain